MQGRRTFFAPLLRALIVVGVAWCPVLSQRAAIAGDDGRKREGQCDRPALQSASACAHMGTDARSGLAMRIAPGQWSCMCPCAKQDSRVR